MQTSYIFCLFLLFLSNINCIGLRKESTIKVEDSSQAKVKSKQDQLIDSLVDGYVSVDDIELQDYLDVKEGPSLQAEQEVQQEISRIENTQETILPDKTNGEIQQAKSQISSQQKINQELQNMEHPVQSAIENGPISNSQVPTVKNDIPKEKTPVNFQPQISPVPQTLVSQIGEQIENSSKQNEKIIESGEIPKVDQQPKHIQGQSSTFMPIQKGKSTTQIDESDKKFTNKKDDLKFEPGYYGETRITFKEQQRLRQIEQQRLREVNIQKDNFNKKFMENILVQEQARKRII